MLSLFERSIVTFFQRRLVMFLSTLMQKKPVNNSGLSRVELEQIIYSAIRHQPRYYGLILDEGGWVGVDTLVYRINFLHNKELLTKATLVKLAEKNPNIFASSVLAYPNTYIWYRWNDFKKGSPLQQLEITKELNNLTKD